ncbi:DMT family transporter [Methylobacillus arboreus]|uniref:DMT family transporter n=1 Tax=Methylobacillus arboreus TaxID=755170 RepID=UPI001E2FFD55|nr:EamA family transporter [Methylobacillus arboreus]MCB5190038.1 DMT family transporter [Methylobacillus arboreus]
MKFWFFPLTAMALWAGNVIVSKVASGIIAPPAITFYRLVVAVSLMSFFVAIPAWKNRGTIKKVLPKLFFLGFLSMAFYQCLSYWAADTSTATNMAIITALTPLMTLLMSALVLRDHPKPIMLLGAALALIGTLYLVSEGNVGQLLKGGWHQGDLLMLTAVASYALYSVLLKHWKLPLPAWQSTYLQAMAALVFMIPMVLLVPAGQAQINTRSLPLILYAGILASVALPYCWIKGIEYLGPNRCSMTMNLLPVFTAGLAVVILHEHLDAHHLIGGSAALLGVMLSQLSMAQRNA